MEREARKAKDRETEATELETQDVAHEPRVAFSGQGEKPPVAARGNEPVTASQRALADADSGAYVPLTWEEKCGLSRHALDCLRGHRAVAAYQQAYEAHAHAVTAWGAVCRLGGSRSGGSDASGFEREQATEKLHAASAALEEARVALHAAWRNYQQELSSRREPELTNIDPDGQTY